MTRKQQRIILVFVAVLALSGAVACVCCPTINPTGTTPIVQMPTQPLVVQPTKPGAALPTQPAVPPTKPPQPTNPAAQPTSVPLGSTTITSFRFSVEMTTGDKESTNAEGERTPTAFHLKSTQVKADGTTETMEIYYVEGYMYTNVGGQWQKVQIGQMPTEALAALDFNALLKAEQAKGNLSLKPVGADIVRGVPCVKYEFVMTDPSEKGQGFAYIGLTDGLVYRIEGQTTDDQGVISKVTWESWDYNKDIVITPPI